ncbi:T6SS effector BTH_I2691 family protein [Salinicola sp. CPA57]|uniref:T6SS effector BTH_I2691 family protein n=1 Tax=Salinicola sp. CPA57 TaxID=1949080 RepID=UPI000DA240C4|nr:T6SS effector BTH_I2691 family protein [Salinicola sp. CPA57]
MASIKACEVPYRFAFNDACGRWIGHVVTDKGYLIEYVDVSHDEVVAIDPDSPQPIDGRLQPPADEQEFACAANPSHAYPGRYVMIPGADKADNVYLSFSDVAWTKRVWKEHATNANQRRDNMRRVSLGAWRGGSAAYAESLEKLGDIVAEAGRVWTPPDRHGASSTWRPGASGTWGRQDGHAFEFSPFPFHGMKEQVEGLKRWADEQAEPMDMTPMLVALEDPVGISADLASLTGVRLKEKMADPEQARPLAVSSAINNIRQGIREDAENRQIYRTERDAYQTVYGGPGAGGRALAGLLIDGFQERQEEMLERWRNPTPAQLVAAKEDAWSDYTDKLDMSRLQSWEAAWQSEMRDFDKNRIAPLARAHVSWMQSDPLHRQLDAGHDDQDIESGVAFVNAMLICIQDTQQYAPCANLYYRWLSASNLDHRNLALRALGYNQKIILERWEGHVSGGLQPDSLRGLPWDGLIGGYENALKALQDGSQNAVVRLTAALGGPFAKVAAKAVDGVVGPALVGMGVIARSPVILADVTMSKKAAIAELVSRMAAINPEIGNLEDLNRAIDIQMRKARIYGVPVEGTGRFRYLILANPKVIEDFPGLNAQGGARQLAESAVLTQADRRAMTQLRWRQLLPTEAGLGVVTGILQVMALFKLSDDLDSSMAYERGENRRRFWTGTAGLVGTVAETVGKWSESATKAGSRLGQAIERYVGRFIRFAGRGLGVGAAIVMAAWDVIRGWQEIQEGNALVGGLLFVSAGFSVAAMGMFAGWFGATVFGLSATGVGIVLVALILTIAIVIEYFKDNKIQDWLERCYFGKFAPSERYAEPQQEVDELKLALNSMGG